MAAFDSILFYYQDKTPFLGEIIRLRNTGFIIEYTAIINNIDDWWLGWIEEIPKIFTCKWAPSIAGREQSFMVDKS